MLYDGLTRQQLRQLTVTALINANTLAAGRVFSWADWPTRPEMFPLLLVSAPRERKVSIFPGTLQFNTTMSIVVVGRLLATLPGPLGASLETLSEQITNALLLDPTLCHQVQQYAVLESQTVVSAEAGQQIGEISITFDMIVYQDYGPTGEPLTDINTTLSFDAGAQTLVIDTPIQST